MAGGRRGRVNRFTLGTDDIAAEIEAMAKAAGGNGAAAARDVNLDIVGVSGLRYFGGRVYEEFLTELQGARWRRVVREMSEQDPVVVASLFAVEMLIRRVGWRFDAYSEEPKDEALATFYDECLGDMSMSWADTVSDILSFLPWGWMYGELCYKLRKGATDDPTTRSKYSDGKYGWRKIPIRAQDTLLRWQFDAEGGIQGMVQLAPPSYVATFIPIDKALLFRTAARKGNPEGVSLLRGAYLPWYQKKYVQNLELIGVERDLVGLPVAWAPAKFFLPTASPDQKATVGALQDMVVNLRKDEEGGLVMPLEYDERGNKVYDLTLLGSPGTRTIDTNPIIERLEQRIAMRFMADVLLLGSKSGGALGGGGGALAENKGGMLTDALGTWLDSIAGTVTEHAVPRLMRANGQDLERPPTLAHDDIEDVNLAELAALITALAGAGFPLFPNPEFEKWIFESMGAPTATMPDTGAFAQLVPGTPGSQVPPPQPGAGQAPAAVPGPADTTNPPRLPAGVLPPQSATVGGDPASSATQRRAVQQKSEEKVERVVQEVHVHSEPPEAAEQRSALSKAVGQLTGAFEELARVAKREPKAPTVEVAVSVPEQPAPVVLVEAAKAAPLPPAAVHVHPPAPAAAPAPQVQVVESEEARGLFRRMGDLLERLGKRDEGETVSEIEYYPDGRPKGVVRRRKE